MSDQTPAPNPAPAPAPAPDLAVYLELEKVLAPHKAELRAAMHEWVKSRTPNELIALIKGGLQYTEVGGEAPALPKGEAGYVASESLEGRALVAAEYRLTCSPHECDHRDTEAMAKYIQAVSGETSAIRQILKDIAEFGHPMQWDSPMPPLAEKVYGELASLYEKLGAAPPSSPSPDPLEGYRENDTQGGSPDAVPPVNLISLFPEESAPTPIPDLTKEIEAIRAYIASSELYYVEEGKPKRKEKLEMAQWGLSRIQHYTRLALAGGSPSKDLSLSSQDPSSDDDHESVEVEALALREAMHKKGSLTILLGQEFLATIEAHKWKKVTEGGSHGEG